jgi:hypothetical protein
MDNSGAKFLTFMTVLLFPLDPRTQKWGLYLQILPHMDPDMSSNAVVQTSILFQTTHFRRCSDFNLIVGHLSEASCKPTSKT